MRCRDCAQSTALGRACLGLMKAPKREVLAYALFQDRVPSMNAQRDQRMFTGIGKGGFAAVGEQDGRSISGVQGE